MDAEDNGWTTNVYGIVPDPDVKALLMTSGGTPELPCVVLDERTHMWGAGRIGAEVGEALGVTLRPARWLLFEEDFEARGTDLAIVFDPLGDGRPPSHMRRPEPTTAPTGWAWTDSARGLAGFAERAVRGWLEGRAAPAPAQRPPWAREGSGWFADVVAWIDTSLAAAGMERTGAVEQLRSWSISCVLQAPTTDGTAYFKAAARLPLFVDEPTLTLRLAEWWPNESPQVIAIEPVRGWLLMRDFGPTIRMSNGEAAPDDVRWASAERMLVWAARRHQESATRTADLLANGCHDRSIPRTLEHARLLLRSDLTAAQLTGEQLIRLKGLESRIEALCADLAGAGMASALVHGDLHPGNVAEQDGQLIVFDWTDAAVAHPFADL